LITNERVKASGVLFQGIGIREDGKMTNSMVKADYIE
jgi:hypothetical protein